jgi:mediator of RNA polymerase II transcription subunit 18
VLPSLDALKPLDPSGSYILEAKIRVQDLNNAAVSEAGVKELNGFREQMKGCVELHAPERLALDTRVRYQPKIIQRPVR